MSKVGSWWTGSLPSQVHAQFKFMTVCFVLPKKA
ncbi:hypothetical protein PASE110613_03075 [Paenibacillus sediminis]|uniref:Uncharacterized protein n=1 Tax=Paenibacillus sediminis TaxID=664909 RepID=A0ABS4GYU1_9BACL|nr:hypothetical protein [Paenibacillus sediminis]